MRTDLIKSVRILQLSSRGARWGRSAAYARSSDHAGLYGLAAASSPFAAIAEDEQGITARSLLLRPSRS